MKNSEQKSEAWEFRGKLSIESRDKVKRIQAEEVLKNNSMTQEETLDYIIKNFQNKKL